MVAIADSAKYISDNELITTMMAFVCVIVMIVAFFSFAASVCKKSKSKEYRELVTDLYVIGTIRNLATKDGIDLIKELKDFRKAEKLMNMKDKDLDRQIEEELKEKVSAQINPDKDSK